MIERTNGKFLKKPMGTSLHHACGPSEMSGNAENRAILVHKEFVLPIFLRYVRETHEKRDAMIELRDVSLIRNDTVILKDISWKVGPDENWVVFGRNSSGKTMLLEIVTGFSFPSSGEVIRFGKAHGEYDVREIRKRIGYVGSSLKDRFSGREKLLDVVLSGFTASIGLYEKPGAGQRSAALRMISDIGMESSENRRFGTLSDGEKQKVLILRALINQPDILILDEPAAGLDISSREDLLFSIKRLHARNKSAIIYVTHHTEEITSLFSHVIILDRGRVFYAGPLKNGLMQEHIQRIFSPNLEIIEVKGRYFTVYKNNDSELRG
jgi:iron complex transport system ATP-binding protein